MPRLHRRPDAPPAPADDHDERSATAARAESRRYGAIDGATGPRDEAAAASPGEEAAAASPCEEAVPAARKRRNFYADLFSDPKRLDEAAQIEGVDDEIALLRTKFHEQMKEHPEDYERIVNSLAVLVRAVVAQYRMSPRSAEGFAEKVTAAVRELGDQMAPWLFTPGGGDV